MVSNNTTWLQKIVDLSKSSKFLGAGSIPCYADVSSGFSTDLSFDPLQTRLRSYRQVIVALNSVSNCHNHFTEAFLRVPLVNTSQLVMTDVIWR